MSPLQPAPRPIALTPIALTPVASLPAAPTSDPKVAKVAQQFEAIFVRQMLAEARKSHLAEGDLLGGQGMDTFRQMQDDRFADIAAERGSFGLAKMIEAQIGASFGAGPSTGSDRAGPGSKTEPAQAEPVEAPAPAPAASKET